VGRRTWLAGNHHWVPRESKLAKQYRKLWGEVYDKVTTHMPGEEHVETQRDEREFGPIGSLSRYDLRRQIEEFGDEELDDEELQDEDY
jgi:hypothetical protein